MRATPSIREKLEAKGWEIPPAQIPPPGVRLTYRRTARFGDVVYVAGHGPTFGDGWGSALGQVGDAVSIEEATAAAQLTALNVLGTIEREIGSLDDVECWLKVNGYVNAVPWFTEHAQVINGFSDVILELYGYEKLAARTSVGVPHLPFGMPVEVDASLAIST